jgi:hypothetical protein
MLQTSTTARGVDAGNGSLAFCVVAAEGDDAYVRDWDV